MRKSCWDCCFKHLSKAIVVSSEVFMGYSDHVALVVGNLSEAEDEILAADEQLAMDIRDIRLKYMADFKFEIGPPCFALINRVLAGRAMAADKKPEGVLP